ncbi:MAG: MarC family protein [Luteibaculaceae bacterium]
MIIEIALIILYQSVAIFTIMNPLGAGAIMLSIIDGNPSKNDFKGIASKNTKAVFITMLIILFVGQYIFNFFGISTDSLRIFGGVILFFMGLNMVQGIEKKVNHTKPENEAAMQQNDISIVPMAIPIIVGPGLASTLITLTLEQEKWTDYFTIIAAIVICSIANYLILSNMITIKNRLGINGLKVFTRLMGLIVGSLAVQMILKGAFAIVTSLQ